MNNTNNTGTLAKTEIYVNEISFLSREEIYLFGFIFQDGRFYETQYVIGRHDLQMLLSGSKQGVEILWRIEELFVQPHQVPATLSLIDLFGTTQVFEAQNIEMDLPYYEDESGSLQPFTTHGLLFVDKVTPLNRRRTS